MTFVSLFSGSGGVEVAWTKLGWKCLAVAETDKAACAVLRHHFPDVPNLGDVTKITEQQIIDLGHIDALFAGWPCQDVSVAGQRKGFKNADGTNTRSGLFETAMQILKWTRARWFIGENVPGLFSVNDGRDFASVVGELAGAKFSVPRNGWRNTGVALGTSGLVEWTVLDAQWFGLAQRRKRVFFVRDSGNWRDRPPVLLESESLQWNHPPRRQTGQGTADVTSPSLSASGRGTSRGQDCVIPINMQAAAKNGVKSPNMLSNEEGLIAELSPTLLAGKNSHGGDRPPGSTVDNAESLIVTHSLTSNGFDASEDGTGRGTPLVPQVTGAMSSKWAKGSGGPAGDEAQNLVAAYRIQDQNSGVMAGMAIRRLTPTECCRLQGFPDDWNKFATDAKGRTYEQSDGPRYRQLGNAVAIPCVEWIARRIMQVAPVPSPDARSVRQSPD